MPAVDAGQEPESARTMEPSVHQPRAEERKATNLRIAEHMAALLVQNVRRMRRRDPATRCGLLGDCCDRPPSNRRHQAD
jgi:hypothetical protein